MWWALGVFSPGPPQKLTKAHLCSCAAVLLLNVNWVSFSLFLFFIFKSKVGFVFGVFFFFLSL